VRALLTELQITDPQQEHLITQTIEEQLLRHAEEASKISLQSNDLLGVVKQHESQSVMLEKLQK
jgi:hypothetical protein